AVFANAAHKALRNDKVHGSCDQERLDAHVHQTADGFRRAVRVKRRKHKVARKRRLDGDFAGFKVTDLADKNDVGILSQEGTQRSGEVETDLLFHLNLVDASQLEFDWIFRGHDVGVRLIEQRDGRVKSIGLARTRRSGD